MDFLGLVKVVKGTTVTLKPNEEESVDFDKTGNVFIDGDNLEVLKVLQRSYYGKIKCIYIDPPYNTGNDFIYNDNFRKTRKEELEDSGDLDENGDLTRADGLSTNRKDSNGHFHSDWLNMMYPRLFLARNLLKQDGVIFVSIDDNEVHNLRMIMNEIFGEENFVAQIIWEKKFSPQNDAKYLSDNHDYILLYCRSKEDWKPNLLPRTEKQNKRYLNPDNDFRGVWASSDLTVKRVTLKDIYPIKVPSGREALPPKGRSWSISLEKFNKLVQDNRIWFGEKGDNMPRIKTFLSENQGGIVSTTIWKHKEVGHNQEAKQELKKIFNDLSNFDTPKPVRLIKKMLVLSTNKEDIILDFFAGSGTTAQAVMEQNSEDDGDRKWICVQLPEKCDEKSEAFKAGYKNIAEIAKERIRLAGKKIFKENEKKVDLGFKSFKLDKSNFKIWQGKFKDGKSLLSALDDFIDNLEAGSTQKNILYELILKSGLDLNIPIQEKEFEGPVSAEATSGKERYYNLGDGKLIIYLGDKISKEMGEFFQNSKPEKIICLERAFQNNDELKANILLQAEQEDIDFKVI
jgi:adenine-specific DNA-methyltransferase